MTGTVVISPHLDDALFGCGHWLAGAEEALLSLDLLARGWQIVYCAEIVTHHHPSTARDPVARSARWRATGCGSPGCAWPPAPPGARRAPCCARQRARAWPGARSARRCPGCPWVGAERPLPTDVYWPPPRAPEEPTT